MGKLKQSLVDTDLDLGVQDMPKRKPTPTIKFPPPLKVTPTKITATREAPPKKKRRK